jgi:hypothetical protein
MAIITPREEEWRLYYTQDESLKPLQLHRDFPFIGLKITPQDWHISTLPSL